MPFGAGAMVSKDIPQMASCCVGIKAQRGGSPDEPSKLSGGTLEVA